MPNSPSKAHHYKDAPRHKSTSSNKHSTQHGNENSSDSSPPRRKAFKLLSLPVESLTHVTSFLGPNSLLALSATNHRLHDHVEDDNTWRRAFVYQFLGISPEGDIHDSRSPDGSPGRTLMLRREETSWKREFILRWNLRRRWENIRPSTTTHVPVHSEVAGMHLMSVASSPALLSVSLRYGIVARSFPLTGKVLRGYLDASGTLNGLGHGNPNAEFAPDVTRCVITADGGTVRIIWGFRAGAVAVTTAQRAMDTARPTGARWARSRLGEAHEGPVEDAAWVPNSRSGPGFFVTGGADGLVKVWDAKTVACLWTSPPKEGQVLKDPCLKIALDATAGVVVAALKSGEVVVYSGFSNLFTEDDASIRDCAIVEVRFSPPPVAHVPGPYPNASSREIMAVHIDSASFGVVSVLTAYQDESQFYQSTVKLSDRSVAQTSYGGEPLGAIHVIQPVFATKPGEHSFVIVGDQLGFISVFPWDTPSTSPDGTRGRNVQSPIAPTRTFEVYGSSAVTALAWTPTVLVTGSSDGTLRAFDSLTFESLRNFSYPAARPPINEEVRQIVVDHDVFAASIGNRVVAWRGEPFSRSEKMKKMKRGSRAANAVAKWHQHMEISRDIAESRSELEREQVHNRRVHGRQQEQNATLQHLGLSEREALEYVLMLSRDEEEQRRRAASDSFEGSSYAGEFDEDIHTSILTRPNFLDASQPASSLADPHFANSSPSRVHVSPRLLPEPTEAGFPVTPLSRSVSTSLSSSLSSRSMSSGSSVGHAPSPEDLSHFPSMSSTPTRGSIPGSPESSRSAWSTPLRSTRSSSGPSSPRMTAVTSSPTAHRVAGMSLLTASLASATVADEEEEIDEDLRYAIELSLAEARSRGEVV